MRTLLLLALFAVVAFLSFCSASGHAYEPVGLYQWRGYVEICVASEEIGSGCSLAQTQAVFDNQEECRIEVPRLLTSYRTSLLRRDPRARMSATWVCDEDRSVFNT